jgi:hypothetical protein
MDEWGLYMTMIWCCLRSLSFVVLVFVPAPYGRHVRAGWGPLVSARVGWIAMETPAVLVFAWAFFAVSVGSARRRSRCYAVASSLRPPRIRLPVPNALRKADDAISGCVCSTIGYSAVWILERPTAEPLRRISDAVARGSTFSRGLRTFHRRIRDQFPVRHDLDETEKAR